MTRNSSWVRLLMVGTLALGACGDRAKLPLAAGFGPAPELPAPTRSFIPTIKVATAAGWPSGERPAPAAGLMVSAFATGLDHPRWLHVLPNGDVLVAETAAPPRPDDGRGLKGWFMKLFMKKAGSAVPSANRITLLRDKDGDGTADERSVFLQNLNSPFGMDLANGNFYVANADALWRYPYHSGEMKLSGAGTKITDLPGGTINHHWTKNVIASPDGTRLYVAVGSNSNAGENGMAAEAERAAIWEVDAQSGAHRIFASGLRNPVGMDWEPRSGALWTAVNERDELGSDLVPDYITSVRDGGFYGWPYSYYGKHIDRRPKPPRPDLVALAIQPDYALGPHTASLGLAFNRGGLLSPAFGEGAFIGQHGSWNRNPPSGYKVIFIPFSAGRPAGPPVDVLTGFLDNSGKARGRPVGVVVNRRGGLLVADDVGGTVWEVTRATPAR